MRSEARRISAKRKKPPVEAASKFLLVAIPVAMMVVARIVGVVAMMVVMMMIAVMAMMVVVMMIAVPSCSWDRATDSDCTDNAQCRSNRR